MWFIAEILRNKFPEHHILGEIGSLSSSVIIQFVRPAWSADANRLIFPRTGKSKRKYKFVLITSLKNTSKYNRIESSQSIRRASTLEYLYFYFLHSNYTLHLSGELRFSLLTFLFVKLRKIPFLSKNK